MLHRNGFILKDARWNVGSDAAIGFPRTEEGHGKIPRQVLRDRILQNHGT